MTEQMQLYSPTSSLFKCRKTLLIDVCALPIKVGAFSHTYDITCLLHCTKWNRITTLNAHVRAWKLAGSYLLLWI
jgi:hypothetical protein